MEDRDLTTVFFTLGARIRDLEISLRLARGDAKEWEEKYKELKEEVRKYEDSDDA